MRILIANRGEIARRVIRTAKRLGHETVAVYADPTPQHRSSPMPTMRSGCPASLAESYLSSERLLAACADTGADAVHPGYGFLSENADFAQAVLDAGLVWIGPRPGAIATMGSKIEARRLAAEARVPIIPGFSDSQEPDDLAAAANASGTRACEGCCRGGGKGIRIAETPAHFAHALSEAVTEATRSFGDGRVIVERYITRPRHVEVQVVGDKHGTVIESVPVNAPCSAATKSWSKRRLHRTSPIRPRPGCAPLRFDSPSRSATTRRGPSSSSLTTRPATTSSSR